MLADPPQIYAVPAAGRAAVATAGPGARHLYWIDWLRFLAAAAVVLDHTRSFTWLTFPLASKAEHPFAMTGFLLLTHLGVQAVVVFFVLSGLLVGGSTIEKVRNGTFDAGAYAADRLSRIYVPLVPALLLSMAILRGYELELNPLHYLDCLVGLQGVCFVLPPLNSPLWTLAYEMWFYVLGGCAAVLCRRGSTPWQRLAAGAGVVLSLGMFTRLEWVLLLCWLLGATGFWLRDRTRAVSGWLAAAGAVVAAAGVALTQMDGVILPAPPAALEPWMPTQIVTNLIIALGAWMCVAGLIPLAPATRPGRWLERLGTPLAAFSYTLYLTHYPVLFALFLPRQRMPGVLTWASAGRALSWLAVCFVVAGVMYELFEARTLCVRRWLRARFAGTRALHAVAGCDAASRRCELRVANSP